MRFALMVMFLLVASPVRASYDETKWGMTMEEVKRLYPGGRVQAGEFESFYTAGRNIGEQDFAQVLFTFRFDRLTQVVLYFWPQKLPPHYVGGTVPGLPRSEADQLVKRLLKALNTKYGNPVSEKELAKYMPRYAWVTKAQDEVELGAQLCDDEPHCGVWVSYKPVQKRAPTDGL